MKDTRIFSAIYSHKANTFARNLRISCHKMLAALKLCNHENLMTIISCQTTIKRLLFFQIFMVHVFAMHVRVYLNVFRLEGHHSRNMHKKDNVERTAFLSPVKIFIIIEIRKNDVDYYP